MRQHLIGLAAAMAVAVVSAPAMAGCGGCAAPVASYSSCAQPFGFGSCGGWGYAGGFGYSTLAQPARYYAGAAAVLLRQPGPDLHGSGHVRAGRKLSAARGWRLERLRRRLLRLHRRPVRDPSHHYYHGMPAVSTPTVYSYRRAYRPTVRYGYLTIARRATRSRRTSTARARGCCAGITDGEAVICEP